MIESIKDFLHVDPWDWIALLFAIFSFLVAVCSWIVAYRTLKSQRQTADNTAPTINEENQKYLLQKLFVNLLEAYANIVLHQKLIKEDNIDLNRSEEITINQAIPENMIHPELFYGNNKKYQKDKEKTRNLKDKFHKVNTLAESISNYNENLLVLRGLIHDSIFDSPSIIFERLERLRNKCQVIVMQWKLAMIILYDDVDIVETVEKNFFIRESIESDDSYLKDRYGFGDKLVSFLLIKDRQLYDSLIIFMNQRAEILEDEYHKYLINDYERN